MGAQDVERDAGGDTVVVTGLGAVTALGGTAEATWERLLRGERAFRPVTLFPSDGYKVRLVAEADGLPSRGEADYSRTSELAVRAAREALDASGLSPSATRVGLVVGGSTAGMLEAEHLLALVVSLEGEVDVQARDEALRHMLSHPLSAPADRIVRELGPFARVRSLSSACSSGANALLVGATWLGLGLVDAVLCGAADALCRVTLSGFNALGATDPEGARPFDVRRRGLTLGEGAGFVVLERAAGAERRGKRAVCSLLGWASRSEAHHITNPEPEGRAPARAMRAALARAGLTPGDVDYVNAHGTGTPLNDPMEAKALASVFGDRLGEIPVSSQKGQIGHTLAACGTIEAVITALAIDRGIVPPTGGLEVPDPSCPLHHVREATSRPVRAALSSSFGFGGMDTVLVLGGPDARSAPPRPARRVVVTGAGALTPSGAFDLATLASLPRSRGEARGDVVSANDIARLDLDRARRLDRGSRMAAIVSEIALGAGAGRGEVGVVLGAAFGSVDTTATYMRRLDEKGARFASPADFPSLVPSSPAGYVSIYLGLGGQAMAVADLSASGETAFVQAFELVASGEIDHVAAVAVEERSRIVDEVFRVLFPPGDDAADTSSPTLRAARCEGAGAVALAAAEVAAERGLPVLARVEGVATWTSDASARAALPPLDVPAEDAVVILGAAGEVLGARVLEGTPWERCRRVWPAEHAGSHEAVGAIGLAYAAAVLAAADGPEVALCIGSARGLGCAILLRRDEGTT